MKEILRNRQDRFWVGAIICALMVIGSTQALAQVAYAKLDQTARTLTFMYDETRTTLNVEDGEYALNSGTDKTTWEMKGGYVNTVIFDESFRKARPTSCYMWFMTFYNLQSIEGMENFVTDEVTNMENMFKGCSKLTAIDLSHFNTSEVTTMKNMFHSCTGLTALDVSHFDTSKVTDFSGMFQRCRGLSEINVSNFYTRNATTLSHLFMECDKIQKLDLNNFKVTNVTDMSYMFNGCKALTEIKMDAWKRDTHNLTNTSYMFYNCSSLESLDVSVLYTYYVTSMAYMFYGCSNLKNLNMEDVYSPRVTSFAGMFQKCSNLEKLDIRWMATSDAQSMQKMFADCKKLTTLDLTNFSSPELFNVSEMFSGASALQTIYVSENFNVSYCNNYRNMFKGCTSLVGGVPFNSNKTGKEMACAGNGYFKSYYLIGETLHEFTGTKVPFEVESIDLTGADGFWSNMPSTVASATYTRQHDGNKYGTICLPFAINQAEGYKLYRLGGIDYDNYKVKLTPTTRLEAGEAGMYSVDDPTVQSITFNATNSDVATNNPVLRLDFSKTIDYGIFYGNYYSGDLYEGMMMLKDDKMVFSKYHWRDDVKYDHIDAFKCTIMLYFEEGDEKADALKDKLSYDDVFTIEIDDTPLHIGSIEGKDSVSAPIAIYDISGRKLQQLQKGMNIVKYADGKTRKIMVK